MPYGVSQEQWNMLPQDERNDIIAAYTGTTPAGPSAATVTASTPTSAVKPTNPPPTTPTPVPGPAGDQPGATAPGDPNYKPPTGDFTAPPGPKVTAFPTDWYKAFFSQYGLPADVQTAIIGILTQYASDPSTAMALAQQYLRTTPWYQQTFPGFNQGVANGLFTDETGYRGYLNAVNQAFNQYLGRHVTSDELSGYIGSGYSPGYVGNLLQGQAWKTANTRDVQQLAGAFGDTGAFSDADLTTLGNEKAGIDTTQGQSLDAMVARAQQRLQTIFRGKLGTPSLTLGGAGLAAPSLTGGKPTADIAA